MKLNPNKCSSGVSSGKFLGHTISQRGIEANSSKIKARLDMKAPRNVKEVQRLIGCLTSLNKFISRMRDKCKSFFDTMKKRKIFLEPTNSARFRKKSKNTSQTSNLVKISPRRKFIFVPRSLCSTLSAVLVRAEGHFYLLIYFVS